MEALGAPTLARAQGPHICKPGPVGYNGKTVYRIIIAVWIILNVQYATSSKDSNIQLVDT